MPSDPSGRYPIGVLARPPQDWFDDQIATGGWFLAKTSTGGMNTYSRAGLYNNATDGSAFKVYGISVQDNGAGGALCYGVYGKPTSALIGNAFPIRFDLPMPWGLIYQEFQLVIAGAPDPFNPPPAAPWLASSGFDGNTYFPPFPMFVVPSGYTLYVETRADSGLYGASFWYQVAHE